MLHRIPMKVVVREENEKILCDGVDNFLTQGRRWLWVCGRQKLNVAGVCQSH